VLFQRNPAICAAELDGEICLFHPESAQYMNLNATGSAIWSLLDAPQDRNWLVAQLLDRFVVEEATCGEQTDVFLSEALQRGVLLEAIA
jgi:Coenzyme PQQ synthesis protein D (PqqD)